MKEAADSARELKIAKSINCNWRWTKSPPTSSCTATRTRARERLFQLRSEANGDALVITLKDQSPPFDPRAMQMPEAQDLAKPLEERNIGGLGIFLAIQGVDRFEYRHEDGSNLNIFEVRSGHD